MKTKRTRWWLKSAALLCATVFGLTAFGSFYEWAATEKAYWDGENSWSLIGDGDVTDRRAGNNGSEIAFASQIKDTDTYLLGFYNGSYNFSADSDEAGLTRVNGDLAIGEWWAADLSSALSIASGTYTFGTVNVGPDATGTLTLNGGTFAATTVNVGTGSTVNLNGGTLSADSVTGTGTLVVGANGGTLNITTEEALAEIPVALTGSGTLTVTSTVPLSFKGNVSAFKGKIAVAAGSGAVTLAGVTVAAGEEVQFGVYTWTGAGTAVEPEEEGGETTYTDTDLWSNVNNWLVNGSIPATAPAADSTVVIPAGDGTALTVTCAGATDFTGDLTIDRDVTFTGSGISLGTVSGTGTLTVDAGAGNTFNFTGKGTIKTELSVENGLYCGTATITLDGALTGTGSISFDNTNNAVPGLVFKGDTSGFCGTYSASSRDNGDRDGTTFDGSALGSENAAWRFGNDNSSKQAYTPFKHVDGLEYKFGSLVTVGNKAKWVAGGGQGSGRLSMHYRASSQDRYIKNTTFKVGALEGSTSNIGGTLFNGTTASTTNPNKIVKVGDSTAYIRLTSNDGLVEVNEGTVYIAAASDSVAYAPVACTITGTGATVTVEDAVGTWQKVIDTEAVADDPDTEEDETVEEVSHQELVAKFVPVLSAEFLAKGYQLNAADGESSTTYTIPYVAKDASDTEYYSVADAIEALDEAEDKTVTLIASTTEEVALPLNYTLVMAGFTAGSVAGIPGVAVEYNEETGTWTTVDNSTATWQGGTEGNWFDADNWSSGYVPDAGTAVTFTGNATVFLADNNTYDCGSIYISKDNATVTFAPVDYNESKWPRVKVYGNIGAHGNCVLKLYRCGIDNGTDGRITVRPTVTFENTTGDSWFTGNFDLQASLNGTGEFRIYGGTIHFATGSGITVADGSVVDFRNYYPTFDGRNGTLYSTGVNGDGRIIVHALPTSSTLTYFQNAFKNAERWTGTCELAGVAIDGIDAANYGNANSTVCFNGVSGYLRYSSGSTTEVGKVKTIEIGANGLTLNNGFSNQGTTTFGYIIAADITGSGPIHFGTKHQTTAVGQYFLTGSLDGFTGAIDFGSLDSYRPAVIIKDPNTYAPAVNDFGQIIVAAERTVTVAGAWNAPGGVVVLGKVNVASTGSLTSTNGLCGDGTVAYEAIPANTTTLTFCAGGTSSGTGREIPAWTGSVELPATVISAKTGIPLPGLSSDNGKLVVKGITRSTASNSIYLGTGAACTMKGTVQLDGDLYITDGNSNVTYTWNKITGSGAFFVTTAGGSASGITHAVTTLDNYTGTITAGGNVSLTIGTVAVDAVEVGVPVVKLAASSNLTTDPAAIALEVAGEASELTLVKADDGNLYVAAASVTVTPEEGDSVTTPFATYEAAAAFADANGVSTFAVLYGDGAVNGWNYDFEAGTLTKNTTAIARVGSTQYDTLAAALEAATAGDTVVLFGTSADAAALSADGATLEIDTTATYTGTLSGDGTVVANVAFTPVFGEWTGTFVVNWAVTGASNGSPFKPTTYGSANSTVKLAKGATDIYLTNASGTYGDIGTKLYFGDNVSFRNGWGGDSQASTIPQLGADEGVVVTTRQGASTSNATYLNITVLKDFAGSFVVNSGTVTTIGSVDLVETPAFGAKVVSATIASGATACSITGKIAEGYPLVAKEDGLYFDPVAQVGEAYYNTLADAITAANGATVTLVKSTTDGVVVAAGQTVVIQFGEYSTGDIAAATDYILNTSWDDATKTGTYTTTAVAAYLTVGETVTPYTVAYTALTDFIASATGSTLRFVGTNPYADTAVPCTTYDAATLTYTKLAAVAQIGTGPSAIQYPTLAEACTAAEQYGYGTVTLLVALGDTTVPEGWDYNAPAEGEEGFGTLTKEMTVTYNVWFVDTDGSTVLSSMQTVESGSTATKPAEDPVKEGKVFVAWTLGGTAYDFSTPVTATITLIASWEDAPTGTEADDGSGNTFTVPATVATPAGKTLTDAATGTINYAQAYALGLWDGTAEGAVAEPTVSINIVNGKVQVAFAGGTVPEAYTVTTILQYKTTLGTSEWQNVEGDGATGALGETLVDPSEMGANKFYRVTVTITNK